MNLYKNYIEKLTTIYDVDEASAISNQVFKHIIGNNKQDYLLLNFENISTLSHFATLQNILFRLLSYEPLQHILGSMFFLNCEIMVNKNVLIPRPETEELVHLLNKKLALKNSLNIIDVCSGSGCIAISIAKTNATFMVYGLEKSNSAYLMAKQNADVNKAKVFFLNKDVFDWHSDVMFDVIISNPPYIMQSERVDMHTNVLNFEPHMALFVSNNNPLIFYKEIKRIAIESLKIGGLIYLEINPILAIETCQLFNSSGFTAELESDMFGKQRFVLVVRNQ